MEVIGTLRLEISISDLRKNLNALRAMTQAKICAVVKANVYGLGIGALEGLKQADEFAVSCLKEAETVCSKTNKPVNILSLPDRTVTRRYGATMAPSVASEDDIAYVARNGARHVNIKLNSGMNRFGADGSTLPDLLRACDAAHVRVKSVFSHIYDRSAAVRQFERFSAWLRPVNDYIPQKHILSGNFVALPTYMHLDMVRPGLVLYGYGHESVHPVARAVTTVLQVRNVCAGEYIGYGQWRTECDRTVAVLGAGYADGVRRIEDNMPRYVMFGESLCPVVGQVCMDALMADVTGLPVRAGDEAVICDEGYSCASIATACRTIPYEICTGWSSRVARIYL